LRRSQGCGYCIIQALVREGGLSQVEVAELLGRHNSWVCRRLALIERLGPKAKDELRVGLLTTTLPAAANNLRGQRVGNIAANCAVRHSFSKMTFRY
jgi:hypothetical protein